MAMSDGRSAGDDGPGALSPGDAVDRFLKKRQTDSTDRTLRSYRNRLKPFVAWCERQELATIGTVTPWHVDQFDLELRGADRAPTTIKGHLATLRVFLKYCAQIGAVNDDLVDAVDVPTLDASEESSDERLAAEDARAALAFFRDSRGFFGVPMHAFLEVAWHTGARLASIRGLDREDYDAEARTLHFQHRPSTDTPLKNKADGERLVGVTEAVCDAVDTYLARERSDKRDDAGREPLFCGRQGRPSFSTFRAWSYQATEPCLWTECPHGRRRSSCEWTERSHASKCPSSRSPHAIRTGSVTWQLNSGLGIEQVATRVNATPATIRRYYDAADQSEEFEQRRQQAEQSLDISGETNDS